MLEPAWFLYKGPWLADKFASYLCTLYEPGVAMISFNNDFVTFGMLGEFVFTVLTHAKAALGKRKTHCPCCSVRALIPVYEKLTYLLKHLKKHEEAIMDSDLIRSSRKAVLTSDEDDD